MNWAAEPRQREWQVKVGPQGRFVADEIPSGRYSWRADHDGITLRPADNSPRELRVSGTTAVTLSVEDISGVLEGVIVDSTGAPVIGASVVLAEATTLIADGAGSPILGHAPSTMLKTGHDTRRRAASGQDGTFRFERMPRREYRLSVEGNTGYVAASVPGSPSVLRLSGGQVTAAP